MKKILYIGGGIYVGIFILVWIFLSGAGSSAASVAPLTLFATEEEAYAYQYIGTELGVPWDIVLLADTMRADKSGEKSLENYNPLYTSLEFCALIEEKYTAVIQETEQEETEESEETEEAAGDEEDEETHETGEEESAPPADATTESETGEGETQGEEPEEQEAVVEWVREEVLTYSGKDEILQYLGISDADLAYQDTTGLIVTMNEKAAEKGEENKVYYTVMLTTEPDFEEILKSRIGLEDEAVEYIMEIFDAGYLPELYGYSSYYGGNIELPDIVVGNVSRAELAQVAVSLLGHPYLMGAKSSEQGAPKGPLDCSGYVDWVYVQCFGVTVSTGKLPEGVAVSGTAQQWFASEEVKKSELKVGDLGFMRDPKSMRAGQVNHVGIYLGTHNGNMLWIHCGGSAYGTADSPKGRVGISGLTGYNNYNPVSGTTFEPPMKSCRFRYYRRPRFTFTDD